MIGVQSRRGADLALLAWAPLTMKLVPGSAWNTEASASRDTDRVTHWQVNSADGQTRETINVANVVILHPDRRFA